MLNLRDTRARAAHDEKRALAHGGLHLPEPHIRRAGRSPRYSPGTAPDEYAI